MSVTVEYLFNATDDFATLVSRFSATLGAHFTPYENNHEDQFSRFLGMEFTLHRDHGLSNDRECN